MEFFYPNLQNDMWRIVGWVFFGDKARFLDPSGRRFDRDRIAAFCASKGIALYDTAVEPGLAPRPDLRNVAAQYAAQRFGRLPARGGDRPAVRNLGQKRSEVHFADYLK